MTFPEHFLRVAGFGQMTHLNLRVGNDTWTSLGDEFEEPMDHFWGQKPLRNDFSRAFPRFGQITHLSWRVGNDTWKSLGDEFKVHMDHFWGQKPLRNDFSRAFSESGWVWSNDTP